LSQGKTETLVLTSSNQLSTLHQWFTFVRLPITYLTSLMMPFPPSLLTEPFKPGNMKVVWNLRLNIGSEGPALIVWTASKCWKKKHFVRVTPASADFSWQALLRVSEI